ncbi:MAG: SAM-dependent tRNA/rRNA cytosine-C5 methylase, partial [Promethearchaeota archaeon]
MIERYLTFLGLSETIKLLKANDRPLIPSIRVNTLKIEVNKLRERLESKGFKLEPIEWVPYGFNIVKETYNLGSLHEFLQGYYYLQNIASMLPAFILDPKSDEVVIDMCAAPGSKATHLAQIMKNKGKLILIERNKNRIPALEINLRRMGILNTIVINQDAINV